MATSSDSPDVSIGVIEEDLSCNICYNIVREPKDLDCSHVYCLSCLEKWVGKQPTIDCPECRNITTVPQRGLKLLKTNLRLKAIAEKYTKRVGKQKGVPICPNHEGERQHFFCVTCGITVCNNCLVLEHPRPDHEIKDLKIVAKTLKSEMKTKMDRVKEKLTREHVAKTKLSKIKHMLKSSAADAKEDIKMRAQHIIAETEAREKEMIACVEATYQQRMEIIQGKETRVTDRLTRLHNVHSASQNVFDTAADDVYMKQHALLIEKMEKLCIFQDGMPPENSQDGMPPEDMTALRFNPGSGYLNQSWFGEVVTAGHRELKLALNTELGHFYFQQAQAIAVTQSGFLPVVDANAKEVTVYRNVNDKYQHQFCLGASAGGSDGENIINKPIAVAATSEGKFLISDNGLVKVFSSAGTYEISWPGSVVATRITTTPNDMVVIGSRSTAVITVHQSNGELIRTHQADCENIADIASNGKQIAFTTGIKGKVCVIDFVTGQTLWTLDMPWAGGICYEQKSNTLLVAGGSKTPGQDVIEQYCSKTGRLISRLADGLWGPYEMAVKRENKLVVAGGKTVKIYSIK